MLSSLVGRGDAPLCPVVVLCWTDDFPGDARALPRTALVVGATGVGDGTIYPDARVGARTEAAGLGNWFDVWGSNGFGFGRRLN